MDRQEYAAEQSHQDYKSAHETGRATAQALILINGGAATAVLAYSKAGPTPPLLWVMPLALIGFALGVLSGAVMMHMLETEHAYFGNYWQAVALGDTAAQEKNRRKGHRRILAQIVCMYLAASCFLISCGLMAYNLWKP
jgi:hypothetical protein